MRSFWSLSFKAGGQQTNIVSRSGISGSPGEQSSAQKTRIPKTKCKSGKRELGFLTRDKLPLSSTKQSTGLKNAEAERDISHEGQMQQGTWKPFHVRH